MGLSNYQASNFVQGGSRTSATRDDLNDRHNTLIFYQKDRMLAIGPRAGNSWSQASVIAIQPDPDI